MKKSMLKKGICILIAVIMMIGVLPMALVHAEEETTTTDADIISGAKEGTTTDSYGATITTAKGMNSTKITYSMTAGSAGTSGNYYVAPCASVTESYYQGSRDKGVVYCFPLAFAEYLQSVEVTAQLGTYGVYVVYASVDNTNWVEIIGETTAVKVPGTGNSADKYNTLNIDEQNGGVNTVTQAVKTAMGNGTADCFYIKIVHPTDWNAPRVYGIETTVCYNTTWSSTTETDSYGATVTTTKRGTDYTEIAYSMTSGKNGTSGGYCVAIGSEGKARDDAYCGGRNSGGVIYKFPILSADSLNEISLSATIGNAYGVDVSLDNATWTEIVPDMGNTKKIEVSLDLSTAVKEALDTQQSDFVYIRFYHDSDWNAPLVYDISVNVKYVEGFEAKALDVSLDGDIGLKFGVALDNTTLSNESFRIEFVKDGETEAKQSMTLGSEDAYEINEGYQFFRLALAPAQMTEKYSIRLVNTETNEVFADAKTYSVSEYAVKMMTYDETTADVLKAMLNYGAYAQRYFVYNVENLANVGYEYTTELEAVNAPSASYTHIKGANVKATTYNVELETKVKLNVLFDNGELLTKELYAKDLDEEQSFVVDDCTFKVSFMVYAGKMLSNEGISGDLANLLKAMILYNEAANIYFE